MTKNGTITKTKRWWKYAVLRGKGIPTNMDGFWLEVNDNDTKMFQLGSYEYKITFEATNEWEQREDGEVAVVYRAQPR